jgi:hypothetical protein
MNATKHICHPMAQELHNLQKYQSGFLLVLSKLSGLCYILAIQRRLQATPAGITLERGENRGSTFFYPT